jgi:large subunit ribosomal protein L14
MIQNETNLVVADNSGARIVRVFRQYGGSHRKFSSLGDVVTCAVKDAIPNGKVKKSQIVKGVIVRVKKQVQRKDGSSISLR